MVQMQMQMVFQTILVLGSIISFVQAASLAKGSCQAYCGNISIPYPFGIGADWYIENSFEIFCNNTFGSPKPFLRRFNISLQGIVGVNYPIFSNCNNGIIKTTEIVNLAKSPFVFSQSKNNFIALGCNIFASMKSQDDGSNIARCMSFCDENRVRNSSSCYWHLGHWTGPNRRPCGQPIKTKP